jgi:hypothetical protein
MERFGADKPNGVVALTVQTLRALWPVSCLACADRPAVVGVPVGAEEPEYPGTCTRCGRILPPVVVLIGVADDAL